MPNPLSDPLADRIRLFASTLTRHQSEVFCGIVGDACEEAVVSALSEYRKRENKVIAQGIVNAYRAGAGLEAHRG